MMIELENVRRLGASIDIKGTIRVVLGKKVPRLMPGEPGPRFG